MPFLPADLGIDVSAWMDACETMGDGMPPLRLHVVDRNRFHPNIPNCNLGGILRAFARRAQNGDLHRARALLGPRTNPARQATERLFRTTRASPERNRRERSLPPWDDPRIESHPPVRISWTNAGRTLTWSIGGFADALWATALPFLLLSL